MKNKILFLLCAIVFIVQKQDCIAQQHAKITWTKESYKSVKTYVFNDFPDAAFNCAQDQGTGPQRTQMNIGSLENNIDLNVNLSIEPSTKGTFESEGPLHANVGFDFNNTAGPMLMAIPGTGTKCTITISSYPAVGGFIIGTFKARLHDESEKNTGYYDVAGAFKIKRTQ